jgi:predicted nucleic acid-binding protein
MMLFPDLPVYKHEKKSIQDVSINNGLHYGGIALTPPVSRFRSTLDAHFDQDQDKYVNDKLARIDVKPITRNAAYVMDYAAKSFKRGRVSDEDIIILPKTISELPSH